MRMRWSNMVQSAFAALALLPALALHGATEIIVKPGESLVDVLHASRSVAKPVVVTLHGGIYPLVTPLTFGVEDADMTWQSADGERPIITGVRRITGWRQIGTNLWEAAVPEIAAGWRFRRLFVNGVEKGRARHPNEGFLTVQRKNIVFDPLRPDRPNEPSQKRDRFYLDSADRFPVTDELDEVEFVLFSAWRDSHHPIASYDSGSRLLVLGTPLKHGLFWEWGRGYPFYFENLPDFMDVPGEWCLLSKSGIVRYLAAAGENPNDEMIEAPYADYLVVLKADPSADGRWVRNVVFRGLTFEKTNFWLPREDCSDMQAADHTGCGVLLKGARDCRFEDCSFVDFGAYCVDVLGGSRDNTFLRCSFIRAGSGGVRIDGGKHADHPFAQTGGTLLESCEIANWGVEFPSACGVIVKNAADNVIRECEIHDGTYTGVSLGWTWSYSNSVSRCNLVVSNHIHNINRERLLSDLGGIYTLGVSPGTVLRANRIHDIFRRNYNGNGIYLDEASSHIVIEKNVIWNAQDADIHIHFGKELTIRNNILAQTRKEDERCGISRGFVEPHVTMFFSGNIIQRLEGPAFSDAPKKWDESEPYVFHINGRTRPAQRTDNMLTDYNYFIRPKADMEQRFYGGYSQTAWQAGGRDVHSIVGDSPFVDPVHGDFSFKPGSSACRVFDTNGVPLKPFVRRNMTLVSAASVCDESRRSQKSNGGLPFESSKRLFPTKNKRRVK